MAKEETIRVTLRLPAPLHAALVRLAEKDHRSLNSEILHLLETARQASEPKPSR